MPWREAAHVPLGLGECLQRGARPRYGIGQRVVIRRCMTSTYFDMSAVRIRGKKIAERS